MSPRGQNGKKATRRCPCGYRDEPSRECSCDEAQLRRYRSKLSGPLLDRIDLRIPVPPVPWQRRELGVRGGTSSDEVRKRVTDARTRQSDRFVHTAWTLNADVPAPRFLDCCGISRSAETLLNRSAERLALSLRAHFRTIRVARTIADLESSSEITPTHIAEALSYRVS